MAHQDRLNIAVFIDFDNIEIGVKSTLGEHFDVGTILDAIKERGEVVSKIAYADQDWAGSGSENIQVSTARLDMDHMTWLNTTTHIVDFVNASFRLTNSVIPTVVGVEPAHFVTMPANGYALVQNTGAVAAAPSFIVRDARNGQDLEGSRPVN